MTRSASGRPLRFFTTLLASWVVLRLFGPDMSMPLRPPILLASAQSPVLTPLSLLDASVMTAIPMPDPITVPSRHDGRPRLLRTGRPQRWHSPALRHGYDLPLNLMSFMETSADFTDHVASSPTQLGGLHAPTVSPLPLTVARSANERWHAGAWLLWRRSTSMDNPAVPTGQLGGSQAGVRLDYDLRPDAASRMTAYGRLTTALQRPTAPEAAVGLSIQPVRAIPITLAAERRIALGTGGRNANAVMAVGGFGPTPIAPSVMAEAYAQTGIVGFRQRDAFIDGKFSLTTPLSDTPFRLGAALSGGAQPGASRLDIGPELQFRLPLPQTNARLSVEWRERIAGNARPGSGLAITLAADF